MRLKFFIFLSPCCSIAWRACWVHARDRTVYETQVTAALKPLEDILVIRVESREITHSTELLST